MNIHTAPNTTSSKNGLSEYGEAFLDFLDDQNLPGITDRSQIVQACKKIEQDFIDIRRKTGENYVAHLYEVAKMYIVFHGQKISQKRIITALLHDNIEDIGKNTDNHDEYNIITEEFTEEIAFFVSIMSKQKIQEGESKDTRNKEYFENYISISDLIRYISQKAKDRSLNFSKNQVRKIAYMAAAIKVCDRIHNLMSMNIPPFTIKQCKRKLQETENYLVPLVVSMKNPVLFDALTKAILHLTKQIHKAKAENTLQNKN